MGHDCKNIQRYTLKFIKKEIYTYNIKKLSNETLNKDRDSLRVESITQLKIAHIVCTIDYQ